MEFNPSLYNYASRRNVVYARNIVATSNPLAAQAGLDVMRLGGNAVDGAVATAAALTVVEPTANGIGGDAFVIVWDAKEKKLHGLNASGYAPNALNAGILRKKGMSEMPAHAWEAVTVPGAPSAWATLSKKFGAIPFTKLIEPAIGYARYGYPVPVNVGESWQRAYEFYKKTGKDEVFGEWFKAFAPGFICPGPGSIWQSKDMATTLEKLAQTGCEDFYRGEIMRDIIAFSQKFGGYFCEADFAEYYPQWVKTISINYKGFDVHEIPPNGQGMTALMALNIFKGFDLASKREDAGNYHLQIESMKLAFADAQAHISDIGYMDVNPEDLLSGSYATKRRGLIGERAGVYGHGTPKPGGTVYLATADAQGNMVSYIQSNYMGFGSGLVVPGRGISLHNRGNNFNLTEGHPNCLAPRKKPYHTIIPGFLMKDGEPVGPFGVMGGFMQPQAHLQVISSAIDYKLNPQDILDAPRWQWTKEKSILLEDSIGHEIAQGLIERGHDVTLISDYSPMGRGQIIWKMPGDVYCAGTEPRADGTIACF